MTTYRERFDRVFQSGEYSGAGKKTKTEALAQLIYANDRSQDKADCLVQALEEYELMTGGYYDPTADEWDDIVSSII